ncbi:G-protein-signaling modulator 2-like protein [Dinothrombium tinctorium]|uniref:G-protein-signaling modulator 2-like protein n=1 Tax=Dinothrombium tinctorium TaxID=1965070 RepID=A0A3S3Q833_9ACAR|nr:G-protein-signaling modulator 2-like protein [Dinothrombium tinctorium]RWS15641.1 G-protein-signaling modulator 2-like protein [Dinothrombium tinctorium]
MDSETCFELALEGERLCKSGDFNGGVAFFEAAIKLGTSDSKNLSAIYSQLGNAHFYLANYEKALHYHKLDLSIAKTLEDSIGEAKACGNIGNTLKMMGDFENAAVYCKKHLDISASLGDKVSEGRALYNLGNVYHTQAKHMAKLAQQDPGEFSDDVKQCLLKAAEYYERNLKLMIQLGDKAAQGRALGNLGNTHYLLGNFAQAVTYHKERLKIAVEFGDKAAERRAECNLGNAHVFLGKFEEALKNYERALVLAQELTDVAIEAQACYSLGNTYTLLRDYNNAIKYHLRHLQLAQKLRDQMGEGRAYWSLGNAFCAIGNHEEALNYATKHLNLAKSIGDKASELTAERSINKIKSIIDNECDSACGAVGGSENFDYETPINSKRNKRFSMENMEILKLTPGGVQDTLDEAAASNMNLHLIGEKPSSSSNLKLEEENFLDLLARFQGKRMDDQRCSFDPLENKENCRPDRTKASRTRRNIGPSLHRSASHPANPDINVASSDSRRSSIPVVAETNVVTNNLESGSSSSSSATTPSDHCREELFDMIIGLQSRRMDEQRAPLPPVRNFTANGPESLPGAEPRNRPNYGSNCNNNTRALQRMATTSGNNELAADMSPHHSRQLSLGANVLPDDDFFEMLMRCQSSRLEDQRSVLPSVVSNGEPPGLRKLRRNSQTSLETRRERIERSISVESASRLSQRGSTVPDDDFFSLILRFQSGRIEDQRSFLPATRRNEDELMARASTSSNSSRKSSNDGNTNGETRRSSASKN